MPQTIDDDFGTCAIAGDAMMLDDPADLAVIYPVVEIFHSIQGEGMHAGQPRVFIRFGRCNLRCEWCDTDFDTWQDMTVIDILGETLKHGCDHVVFTGGEPAIHDLWPLARCLRNRGIHLSIETNGTVELPDDLIDWICVSPKDQLYPNVSIKQRTGDELKVVWVGQELSMYDELKNGFDNLFLQPCYDETQDVAWNGHSFRSTVDLVKENPGWRLSLQTHKWLGVD